MMDGAPEISNGEGGGEGEGEDGGGGGGEARRRGRPAFKILLRLCFSLIFSLAASFLFSFTMGIAALAIGSFSKSAPVSVTTTCKILSSSVDIRSSKICELGMLNYKAKTVFYPSEKAKFRCRYDYYWTSVFEVEYREYFSGQVFHAVAEAPKEALPEDCRPGFGTAWLTRMMFKVNETYNCRYMLGSKKADIYTDDLFNCQGKEPSTSEMLKRYYILFGRLFSEKDISGRSLVYMVTGVVSGMIVAILFIILIKSLHISTRAMARKWDANKARARSAFLQIRRTCILFLYFFVMCWLTLQYVKMIGFKQFSFYSKYIERTA